MSTSYLPCPRYYMHNDWVEVILIIFRTDSNLCADSLSLNENDDHDDLFENSVDGDEDPDDEIGIKYTAAEESSSTSIKSQSTSNVNRTSASGSKQIIRSKQARYRKTKEPDVFEKALIDLCTSTKKRRENIPEARDEDEAFLEPYILRLKKLPNDVKGVVQFQIAQLFFNAENRHLPPQTIMPLPPMQACVQPQTHCIISPSSTLQQCVPLYQCSPQSNHYENEHFPSVERETSDVLGMAMTELNN
ncbi:uncharacterized protein LOC121387723 [Gigantopelta aegis]|uniref:uncharacterized protein LOC121387723 n=1 Tax=Gigantopelta aegis TaxID=1735272 RepID=UPI001B88DA2B|nr:uncharacterized protein LOC121387723 [Gigantopelta aegis]